MGKALYRKYRSRNLSEVVGQEHITTTLANALRDDKIAHAYLLTGPRGVGKTSVARILAHEINGLPYSEDPHLDIIEIDAASNNGVEDVRELRDNILSAPTSAKYKVFIIDEVHMLSKAAFNALLKTLEEPPAHVVFILATTESHKLPDTIISRTQRYGFRPVTQDAVIAHLRNIAQKEKLTVDDDALALIAAHGEGSFRDSISLLDQAGNTSDHVTRAGVEQLLGKAPADEIAALLAAVAAHDTVTVLAGVQSLVDHGYEPAMIAVQLGQQLRDALVQGSAVAGLDHTDILALLKALLDVPPSHSPKTMLELVLLSTAPTVTAQRPQPPAIQQKHVAAPAEPTQAPKPAAAAPVAETSIESEAVTEPVDTPQSLPTAEPEPATAATPAPTADDDALWQEVLQQLKKTHNTLYGIARMAKPTFENDSLTLGFTFAFHQKRLNEPKNQEIISSIVDKFSNRKLSIQCVVTNNQVDELQPSSDNLDTINNIFGNTELLDS